MSISAQEADTHDVLKRFRDEFHLPQYGAVGADLVGEALKNEPCTYLCGNSLGPLAKRSEALIHEELAVWATRAVSGHFDHPHDRAWLPIADNICPALAQLVGAQTGEVACMSTLTTNLHLLMQTFYKPTAERYKIICEAHAFPSDRYAFASQAAFHGFDPASAVIEVAPRESEYTLRDEDILAAINTHGASTALVLFSGVQFYTGQWFPMEAITKKGHEMGCIVGFDLAHAIGNVPLKLHEWEIDFAAWCTYKYLNSGPGGIGGLYINSKWDAPTKFAGWWGHDPATRFEMPHKHSAIPGAAGYQQSNPSALLVVTLLGSLELFGEAGGMDVIRTKSVQLTAFLEHHLRLSKHYDSAFTIITPTEKSRRGAQLSLLFKGDGMMQRVFDGLKRRGVIGDERQPDVIRLAPVPLYNTFADCERAVNVLEEVLGELYT